SRAAISRRLSEAVLGGKDMLSAAVSVFEELEGAPGTMVPIGKLEGVSRREVCIEGTLTTVWESESPAIQQAGLLEDE
ncbi:DNA-binding protein, partial [Salinisphaera sp. USBA-960]|nr:DNA-binding protein [Salifodinibacter halophilus]